jgi:excisionase family DNA binding protein
VAVDVAVDERRQSAWKKEVWQVSQREERLLTYREAAERLRASRSTVRRLVDAGALERVKIGRLVRLRAGDVERLIERGTRR